ncbi:hypothetical protein AB8807_17950 [Xanthomonas campestris pv. olitorii]|uniref:hypothetical protein n=1 Tax=Xanthomonas TaxID=338 RepID=UPI000EFF618E|nr:MULTISPECIES: hypothetical protein [Xanthomonas]MBV6854961.1 hypothetical protein [Xanthomonas campestris pv. mirabilis]MDO7933388.1 hypothetical protein [Xanthomonas euvesicatoria pv. eucalypti]WVK03408.1 hypothetical protein KWH09_17910 [Xanthomonas campestris pv. olitorii]AYO94456.1 hypothetical protein Xcom_04960 [Xanthomonas axonopodis pv. commiphoreae]MDO7937619.1 hypothetical protein [Xanthomonas euvesicatoria pv. eucalypti]
MTQFTNIVGTDRLQQPMAPRTWKLLVAAMYAFVGLLILLASYATLEKLPAVRVGDGAEYYAMERAISIEHRPYVQAPAWEDYERIRASGAIASLQPSEVLRHTYLPLTLGSGTDFNHFWLYPALAGVVGKIGDFVGLTSTTHAHFMLLHATLLSGLILLCFRLHGFLGVCASLVIVFSSPSLWYLNKVHTELFTIFLSIAAVACALRSRWTTAGLLLAVVTTQNISFIIPAFAACLIALMSFRNGAKPGLGAVWQVTGLCLATLTAALHPAYYFFRFGGLTPQLINVGADTSHLNPLSSLQYLLDPDIGLLPNWPAGLAIIGGFAILFIRRQVKRPPGEAVALFIIYLVAALAAQAATNNINSGGTPGPARYGLWYLCLFYPLLVLADFSREGTAQKWIRGTWAVLILLGGMYAVKFYKPWGPEAYTAPSRPAKWIYTHLPRLWDPAPEVFSERNAGIGENVPEGPALVFGPKCRKALYFPGIDKAVATYPKGACIISSANANTLIHRHFPKLPDEPKYFTLASGEIDAYMRSLATGASVPAAELRAYLQDGWSVDEPWGVWSEGDSSTISFQTSDPVRPGTELILYVNGLWNALRRDAKVEARVNKGEWQTYWLSASSPAPSALAIHLPALPAKAAVSVELHYDKPASPAELGISADARRITIGLTSMEIKQPNTTQQ